MKFVFIAVLEANISCQFTFLTKLVCLLMAIYSFFVFEFSVSFCASATVSSTVLHTGSLKKVLVG